MGACFSFLIGLTLLVVCGCSRTGSVKEENTRAVIAAPVESEAPKSRPPQEKRSAAGYVGFDRNEYPGDNTMSAMRKTFTFTGYWLTVPPGAMFNQWKGKREILKQQGWGFLLLANGKLDAEILTSQKKGTPPAALGRADAADAVAAAKKEGFPPHSIVFLDQEEGGRLLDEQAAYLLGWTEAVAASAYRPGVYASGQRVQDDPGVFITTVEDIRNRVKKGNLHKIEMFVAEDDCPPAPGCVLTPKPLADSGTPDAIAWQYSQSPRRPAITKSCAQTYAADGNCYAPGFPAILLDMDVASSPDPSNAQ